jgi:hypothetical protein
MNLKFWKKKINRNTVHDPEFAIHIEPAFKFLSTQYYRFKKEVDVPYGRYKWVSTFLYELELRMDLKTLQAYLDKIKSSLSGEKGKINLSDALTTIAKMESRMALHFDVETAKKLASVIYFDENEDLTSYDREKGKEKIQAWSKDLKVMDFFLTKPMRELLGLSDISEQSLADYINRQLEIIKELTSGMPEASLENTSMSKEGK